MPNLSKVEPPNKLNHTQVLKINLELNKNKKTIRETVNSRRKQLKNSVKSNLTLDKEDSNLSGEFQLVNTKESKERQGDGSRQDKPDRLLF